TWPSCSPFGSCCSPAGSCWACHGDSKVFRAGLANVSPIQRYAGSRTNAPDAVRCGPARRNSSPQSVVWRLMLRPLHVLTLATLLSGSAAPARDGLAGPGSPLGNGSARLPRVAPESVGMSPSRLAMIDDVVLRGIGAGGFPGAAVIVARHGGIVWQRGYGRLDWQSTVAVEAGGPRYDLPPLTKGVARTAAALLLVAGGKLRLDEHVTHYLPAFSGGAKEQITIRDLLTHRSGLPAGRDLSKGGAESARRDVLATSLVRAPGSEFEYSDLGLDVMGFVIE